MTVAQLSVGEGVPPASGLKSVIERLRILPKQVALALGARGVAWATAAALVGVGCCVLSVAIIVLSMKRLDVDQHLQSAAASTALDQSQRHLMRTILLMTFDRIEPGQREARLQQAWSGFEASLAKACPDTVAAKAAAAPVQAICAAAEAAHRLLAPEISTFESPAHPIDPTILARAILLHGDANSARLEIGREADALVERMASDYDRALWVLALGTTGFAAAGLVLILLVARASVRHNEQWRQAAAARDLLHETIEALPVGVVVYDQQERLMLANAAAARIKPALSDPAALGKTHEALARENAARLEAEGRGPQPVEAWLERFRSKGEIGAPQPRGGRWYAFSEQATPAGRTVGLRIDVTDLKSKELEIERAHARYQTLVDSLSDVVYELDVETGRFTFANSAVADVLGLSVEEFVGMHFGDLPAAEDRERVVRQTTRPYVDQDRAGSNRFRVNTAAGKIKYVEVRNRRRLDERGRVVSIGVLRDVDDRVRVEESLREETARLRSIVDSAGATLLLLDPDLRILMANTEFARLYADVTTPEDLVGRRAFSCESRLPPEVLAEWRSSRLTAAHLSGVQFAQPVTSPGGRRIHALTVKPVADQAGMLKYIVVMGVDDTERRETLDLLKETIDTVPAGIVVYDQQERLVLANAAAAHISPALAAPGAIGKTYETLARQAAARLEADGLGPQPVEAWLERFHSKGVSEPEFRDGHWYTFSERATPAGRTIGLRIDVSDLKAKELEVEAAHARYQTLVDSLSDIVYELDVETGRFTFANAAIADVLGLSIEEFVGTHFIELTAEEDREQVIRSVKRPYDQSDRLTSNRFRMHTAEGRTKHIELRARRRIDDHGRLISVGVIRDVDERVRLEHRLEEETGRLRSIVDSAGATLLLLDRDERILMVNAEFAKLAGVAPEALVGQRPLEVIGSKPNLSREVLSGWRSGPLTPQQLAGVRFDQSFTDREGRRLIHSLTIKPIADAAGMLDYFVVMGVDVTDLKNRELDLERARAQLQEQVGQVEQARTEYAVLVDSLSDLVVKADAESGVITFASAAAFELWGLSPAKIVGKRIFDFVTAHDLERVMIEAQAVLQSPSGSREVRYQARAGDTLERHVEARFRWMPGPDGRRVIVAVIRDVEQRVQLERRLAEEMERLRSIVESSGAVVVLVDRALKVVMVNHEFTAITGIAEAKVRGRPIKDVIACSFDPDVIQQWLSRRRGDRRAKPVHFTNQIVDPEGVQRSIAVTATPVFDGHGELKNVVFLGIDDTDRRAAEQALVDTERLSTVGEMAATLAHEISQPLQVINIASTAAADELDEAAEGDKLVDSAFVRAKIARIGQQVDRATRIVSELRAFVRGLEGEQPTRFDPAIAVQGAVDLTSHGLLQARTRLTTSLADKLPHVLGHVGRLEQVVVNLINNARDAGAPLIEVSLASLHQDGRDFVRVVIEDTGPGIAEHVLPRLFQSFITTKPRGKGTGLGLRICRRIVEEMGGTITAANRDRGGARFEILLPAAMAD